MRNAPPITEKIPTPAAIKIIITANRKKICIIAVKGKNNISKRIVSEPSELL